MWSNDLSKDWTIGGHKIDNSIRKSGITKYFVNQIIGQNCGITRFPYNSISLLIRFKMYFEIFMKNKNTYHHSRSICQISSNSGKVERWNWSNKTFQRSVSHQIQCSIWIFRNGLVFGQFFAKISIESEEVYHFSSSIDFSL